MAQAVPSLALPPSGTGAAFARPACPYQVGERFGEARHPGPHDFEALSLFSINPTGLRGKEAVVMEMGPGITFIAESQLSAQTQRTCRNTVATLGRACQRNVRSHFGAPAPLRSQSTWAGSWTGVATFSDFASRPVRIQWPPEVYETGRVAITQHHVNALPLTTAVVYGEPKSQAHPQALADTERILGPLTRELILGRHGPRVIAGDFNHPISALRDLGIWMENGWVALQSLAQARWGTPIANTCKDATRHNFVWLSPEAAALCQGSMTHRLFADHLVLEAKLHVPPAAGFVRTWPRPATIPWEDLDIASWHEGSRTQQASASDPTEWFQTFTRDLQRHARSQGADLPSACLGRAERTEPAHRAVTQSVLRASRPGEVSLQSDLVGREVKRWFQQLRRLQNLRNALKAGNQSPQAQAHRQALWASVIYAKGFTPCFKDWWTRRTARLQGAPLHLGDLPSAETAQVIFDDFQCNFRRLENWHLKRRGRFSRPDMPNPPSLSLLP